MFNNRKCLYLIKIFNNENILIIKYLINYIIKKINNIHQIAVDSKRRKTIE